MLNNLPYRKLYNSPGRPVFHHPGGAPSEGHAPATEQPEKAKESKVRPPKSPLPSFEDLADQGRDRGRSSAVLDHATESITPAESREMNEKRVSHVEPFANNPEKNVSAEHLNDFLARKTDDIGQIWRFLSPPRRMQYGLIQAKSQ